MSRELDSAPLPQPDSEPLLDAEHFLLLLAHIRRRGGWSDDRELALGLEDALREDLVRRSVPTGRVATIAGFLWKQLRPGCLTWRRRAPSWSDMCALAEELEVLLQEEERRR